MTNPGQTTAKTTPPNSLEAKIATSIKDLLGALTSEPGVRIERSTNTIVIQTPSAYEGVASLLGGIIELEREVSSTFDPIIKKQRDALTEAQTQRARHMDPLVKTEKAIKLALAAYIDAQRTPSIEESISTPPEEAMLDRTPPRVSAIAGVRETWDFEVLDARALIPALLTPDVPEIRKRVKALGESAVEACSIAGKKALRVFKHTTVAARR